MATPATGQISFADLNTEILSAGSTAQINMNTAGQRMGYGLTSQVSLSDLKKCYGAVVTVGYYQVTDGKTYEYNYYGYSSPSIGNVGTISLSNITSGTAMAEVETYYSYSTAISNYIAWVYNASFLASAVNRVAQANSVKTISLTDNGTPGFYSTVSLTLPAWNAGVTGVSYPIGVRWA